MDSHSKTLALLYRNLEKWLSRVGKVIGDGRPKIEFVIAVTDKLIRMLPDMSLPALSEKYKLFSNIVGSDIGGYLTDPNIVRAATIGLSSSDELELGKLGGTTAALMESLANEDIRGLILADTMDTPPAQIHSYLSTVTALTLFEIVLLGVFGGLTPRLAAALEEKKTDALGAKPDSFPGDYLLARFNRETSYSNPADIFRELHDKGVRSGATRWEECAPCIVLTRTIGSQYYFNFDSMNSMETEKYSGLSNAVLRRFNTIVGLNFTPTASHSVKIYGVQSSATWILIDSIDGLLFAVMSRGGMINIPREHLLDFFGELPDKAGAYNSTSEDLIFKNGYDPRAKLAIQKYTDDTFKHSGDEIINAVQLALSDDIADRLTDAKTLPAYNAAMSDRARTYKIVRAAYSEKLSLLASVHRDRAISTFTHLIEKHGGLSAPSPTSLSSANDPNAVLLAAGRRAISGAMAEASRTNLFQRPDKTLSEFIIF